MCTKRTKININCERSVRDFRIAVPFFYKIFVDKPVQQFDFSYKIKLVSIYEWQLITTPALYAF